MALSDYRGKNAICVSIPKRVSEVLWRDRQIWGGCNCAFQSLKGFQRFCGCMNRLNIIFLKVSIPKRVSEVLWLAILRR